MDLSEEEIQILLAGLDSLVRSNGLQAADKAAPLAKRLAEHLEKEREQTPAH